MKRLDYWLASAQPPTTAELRAKRTLEKAKELVRSCLPPKPDKSEKRHSAGQSLETADRYDSAEDELRAYMKELAASNAYGQARHVFHRGSKK